MPVNKEEILSMIEYNVNSNIIMHASNNYTSNFGKGPLLGVVDLRYLLSMIYFAHGSNSKLEVVFMDRISLLENLNFFSQYIDLDTISRVLANEDDNFIIHGVPLFFLDGLSVNSFNEDYFKFIDKINPKFREYTVIKHLSIIKLINNDSYLSIY